MSDLLLNNTTNPGTPALGKIKIWANTLNKRLYFTDDAGLSQQVGVAPARYYVDDYGVTPATAAATNVTNMNTLLQTIAPDGSEVLFGNGTYQFSAGLTSFTTPNKDFQFRGIRGGTTIAITAALGSATPFMSFNNGGFYTSMRDLSFVNFATQSSNYLIETNNNANVLIQDCFFTGASQYAGIIDFTGTNSGNGAMIKNIYCANFNNTAINVSSPLDTMYIEDLEILGGLVTTSVGLAFLNGGAACLTNVQIIKCGINLSLNAITADTVSAVFVSNSFFDQGITNSLLINGAGTGTVCRCHFTGSWFTASAVGVSPNCVQISTSGTAAHAGIEFKDCWIINATTGSTGTLDGFNITAAADLSIQDCQIAGWTNGIVATGSANAPTRLMIQENNLGGAGLIPANTTGIVLNSGQNYGNILIQGNDFSGVTTPITDSSVMATGATKQIQGNGGLVVAPPTQVPNALIPLTTVTLAGVNVYFPAGVRVGTTVRIIATLTNAATLQTLTPTLHFGTAGTNADAAVCGLGLAVGTAAVGGGKMVAEFMITSSTTCIASIETTNAQVVAGVTGTGLTGMTTLEHQMSMTGGATPGPVTIATSSASFLGLYLSSATASAVTVRTVEYEVIQQ